MRGCLAPLLAVAVLTTAAPAHADDPNWGVQLGGPAFLEVVFRPRVFGPLRLEVGALGLWGGGGFWNASAGLYVEILRRPHWEAYGAAGAAIGQGCGEDVEGEDARGLVCDTMYFGSARFGAAIGVGEDRENRVTVDAGLWHGRIVPADDPAFTFLIPMGGVGFYW